MDFFHDLFCYATLFITLKYIENIMSTSSKDLEEKIEEEFIEEQQNDNQKRYFRDNSVCEELNKSSSNVSKKKNEKSFKLLNATKEKESKVLEEKTSELNLKSSSTVTTSDIIPIYEYSLKPAASTYMLNESNCTSMPDFVVLRRNPDPHGNISKNYITDHTSEYSSSTKCSESSLHVHVSSATTFFMNNKTDISLNALTDSSDALQHQIMIAAENINKKLYEIESSTYKSKEKSTYAFNRDKSNLPSTSKVLPSINKKNNFILPPVQIASEASELSSGSITPHETKPKGATHEHLMKMLAQVTMQNYHSYQELNDSSEVAMIDEHVKMNNSVEDPSIFSEYSNSDQFSNITGHGLEHLGEDELYGKGTTMVSHKNLLDKRFVDHSPNGSMIAVLDFEICDYNEAGTSKD